MSFRNLDTNGHFNLDAAKRALEKATRNHKATRCIAENARSRVEVARCALVAAKDRKAHIQMTLERALVDIRDCEKRLCSARNDLQALEQLPLLYTPLVRRGECAVSDLIFLSSHMRVPSTSITRLPIELVLDIFEFAQNGLDQRDIWWNRSMVLSQVNRRWRYMALAVPAVWSTIDYRFGLEWAYLFVRRARSHPLHVVITYLGGPYEALLSPSNTQTDAWSSSLQEFLLVLLPHALRWVSLTMSNVHNSNHVLEWIRDAFEERDFKDIVLENISLSATRESIRSRSRAEIDPVPLFTARRVFLDFTSHFGFNVYSSAVTHLEIREDRTEFTTTRWQPNPPDIFQILGYCPNLCELLLYMNVDVSAQRNIELARLRRMTLCMAGAKVECLLHHLRTPELAHVELQVVEISPEDAFKAFSALHPGLPLVELTLSRLSTSQTATHFMDPIPRCSLGWPLLEVLELRGTFLGDAALAELAASLPRLRHLQLNLEPYISPEGLERVLRTRMPDVRVSNVCYLEIVWCEQFKEQHKARMAELVPEQLWWVDDPDLDDGWEPSDEDEDDENEDDNGDQEDSEEGDDYNDEDADDSGSDITDDDDDSEYWDDEL